MLSVWRLLYIFLSCLPICHASGCNGQQSFCDRKYSNVSIIGTHNSYGVDPGNLAANQNYTIATQLENGVRMLQVQGFMEDDELHLCHTSCLLLDAGTFTNYLSTVKTWLDANPMEVVTILMVNSDGLAASVWGSSFSDAGLSSYAYTPPSVPVLYNDWPTLQELITSGTRLVAFLAQEANYTQVPYLLDEFTHIWETPYDQTDNSFPCTVDRVTGDYTTKMYLINHFLDVDLDILGFDVPIPDTAELDATNAVKGTGSLSAQSDLCISDYGYKPTFTLVDYYDVGNGSVFEYTADLNDVTYVATPIGNSSDSSNTSNDSSPSSSSSGTSTASTSSAEPEDTGYVTSVPLSRAISLNSSHASWAFAACFALVLGFML